jgi:hypothetical protein
MSSCCQSRKRYPKVFSTALGLAVFVCLALAQVASAKLYEGEPGVLAYHEASTADTWVLPLPSWSNEYPILSTVANGAPKSAPYTSPSVTLTSVNPGDPAEFFVGAVNAESGTMYARSWYTAGGINGNKWFNTGLGFEPHTSPSVANFFAAFHALGSSNLYIYNIYEGISLNTGAGMAVGTSPSITVPLEGGHTAYVAFVASGSNTVGVYEMNTYTMEGRYISTGLGVAPGTSPSIAASEGNVYVAFVAAGSNHLGIYQLNQSGWTDTGLGVAAETSPSIIEWGGYLVAFQAAGSHHLGLHQSGTSTWFDTGQTMQSGSSPSLTARWLKYTWAAAYQAAGSHHLMVCSAVECPHDTGWTMGEHSSPSIAGG